jgi:hypothetical protein
MLGNLKNKSHLIKGKRERQNAEIGMGKAEWTSKLKIGCHPYKNQSSNIPSLGKTDISIFFYILIK